jgi:hypothetical protein
MTDLVTTRRSLHGVAELLVAGPQHAQSGTIRLTPCAGGFTTVAAPEVSVVGGVLAHGGRSEPLDGRTVAEVGAAVGLAPCSLADLYSDGSGIGPDDRLTISGAAEQEIAAAFERGRAGLAAFHPEIVAVLWPEHFDLGITVDAVNYGISPGDDFLDVPYAYVGPHFEMSGPFWNAPFGAARPLAELPDLAAWFGEGAELASTTGNDNSKETRG